MAEKYSVSGWIGRQTEVIDPNKDHADPKNMRIVGYTLSVPQWFASIPVGVKINFNENFQPLTQSDAELCMWLRMHWNKLDTPSKDLLAARFIKATKHNVVVVTGVKIGKSKAHVKMRMTLAESFVKIAASSNIEQVVGVDEAALSAALEQANPKPATATAAA